ncbi:MAG: transposase [Deltaproteobacteria bacterium]|nr:transposase [Deltaproteobacteria bacterium]
MRMIRWHNRDFVHFITNRTQHEMFFLLPTPKINSLILFWLTRAKQKKGQHIELFSFVFMANHYHMLLRDPMGELPEFIGYFQGNLAKAVNKEIGRRGTFWSREYDDVIVDGEEAFINRFQYIAANPVVAGLVETPADWGGVSSVPFALSQRPVEGKGLNVTDYGNATRHNREANEKDFEESYEFLLSALPMLAEKSDAELQEFLRSAIDTAPQSVNKQLPDGPPMGMKKIMMQSPLDSPSAPAGSPRFKFLTHCKERKKELIGLYREFVSQYRKCTQVLMAYFCKAPAAFASSMKKITGKAPIIIWPPGCYVPSRHEPIAE